MSRDAANAFWTRMAELERARHQPFRVEARFAQDGRRATPIQIELADDAPQAIIGDELAALRDKVDPGNIAARHPDANDGQTWRTAFEEARSKRQLSLNHGVDPVSRTPDGASKLLESGIWQSNGRSTPRSLSKTRYA